MSQETKGIIFILIFQFLIGLSPVLIKQIDTNLPGSVMVFLRFGLSTLFFLSLIIVNKKLLNELKTLTFKKMRGLIFLGLLGSGLGSLLFVFAVRTIGASLTSIISNLEIPLGILFAVFFLKEKLTKPFIFIGTIILVGFYMVTVRTESIILGGNNFLAGVAFALTTAIIFGLSTILGKILLKENITPTIISFFRQGFGAIFNLIIILFTIHTLTPIINISIKDWVLIAILGIIISGLGFIFYYEGLHRVSVKKISFFFIAAPIVSVISGVLTGERLNMIQWMGVFVILIGITALLKLKETPLPEKEGE